MAELVTMPPKGERIRQGEAISYVTTGFTPFIPLTQQYKWGMIKQSPFVLPGMGASPKATGKGMGGAGGVFAWAAAAHEAGGGSFEGNIDRYNQAKTSPEILSTNEGYLQQDGQQYPQGVFQTPDKRDGQYNALADDLRYTPDRMIQRRSEEMAAELSQIIDSYNVDPVKTTKDLAEAEEEAILDLMESDMFPELNDIMKKARQQAKSHGALPAESNLQPGGRGGSGGKRGALGLSPETFDWSHKSLEDLTKMYAIINIANEFGIGDKLSNRVIGAEVTKDETKFFALDEKGKIKSQGFWGIDKGDSPEEQRKKFHDAEKTDVKKKMDDILKQIDRYYRGLDKMIPQTEGRMLDIGGIKMDPAHSLAGFTQQLISRAQEALLSPNAPGGQATYAFQYVAGKASIGGPYQIWVEIQPQWSSDKKGNAKIVGLPFGFRVIPMTGVGGARQASIANLILMKIQKMTQNNQKLNAELVVKLRDAATKRVATIIQLAAQRGEQMGAVFHQDLAMQIANSFMGFSTVVATMTNKDVADALGEQIAEALSNNPSLNSQLGKLINKSMNDSSDLTTMWKQTVGGDKYEIPSFVYALKGGPFQAGSTEGAGAGITPIIGASSELGQVESLAKNIGKKWRVGGAAKNAARRLSGEKLTNPEILWHPKHESGRQAQWMSAHYEKQGRFNPSTTGFEDVSGDGVIKMRQSWFVKYGATRHAKPWTPGQSLSRPFWNNKVL